MKPVLRHPWLAGTVGALLAVVSCATEPCTCSDPARYQLALVRGDGQSGDPGLPLADSVVVRVNDLRTGAVADGVQVMFVVEGSDGSASPGVAFSDAAGLAAAQWTLGSASGVDTLAVVTDDGIALFVEATVR